MNKLYQAIILYSTRIYKKIIKLNIIYILILIYILLSIIIIQYQCQINEGQLKSINNHNKSISIMQRQIITLGKIIKHQHNFNKTYLYEINSIRQQLSNQRHVNETFSHVVHAVIDMTKYNGQRIVHVDVPYIKEN